MLLSAGARLGPCEILSALGAGGMGEVYRALDTKLKRDVALKVLAAGVCAGSRSPRTISARSRAARQRSNHPNVAAIFSIEEADGVRFMTMELVEGRTLDRMIPTGAVSMAQFFDIAIALADALVGGASEAHHPPRFETRERDGD